MIARNRGYTLVEVMVALAVFAIFMISILNLLDASSKLSRVETALADTQENTRFAAYHIMRTARMMGGAELAFAADLGGGAQWVGGRLRSNQTGTIAIPFGNVTVLPGADVLTLRGFFEISPFFTNPADFGFSGNNTIRIRESNTFGTPINNLDSFAGGTDLFQGRGIVFMGSDSYAVGQVAAGAVIGDSAPTRTIDITFVAGTAAWSGLNPPRVFPPTFDVYRVGILESYTYYVHPDRTLMRMRADATGAGGTRQPVAVNIGGLQIALGLD
ncbi:MAG: PilW family protein, partial [Thermoanaerobaculales bacterium]